MIFLRNSAYGKGDQEIGRCLHLRLEFLNYPKTIEIRTTFAIMDISNRGGL